MFFEETSLCYNQKEQRKTVKAFTIVDLLEIAYPVPHQMKLNPYFIEL